MEFGEQIYFFPLGKVHSGSEASIEIQLALHPYLEDSEPPAEPPQSPSGSAAAE
jgi:hypothetical protein